MTGSTAAGAIRLADIKAGRNTARKSVKTNCILRWLTLVISSTLRFLDKTKVKAKPEQDEMDNGAHSADFRRKDKICPEQRHRYLDNIEIELNSCADKERARQKFAKLTAAPCEIKRRQTENDYCSEKEGDHVGFLAASGFAPMAAVRSGEH